MPQQHHSGCDGHSCPPGESHDHYTEHAWWWDHHCKRVADSAEVSAFEIPNTYGETGLYFNVTFPVSQDEDRGPSPALLKKADSFR